MNKRQKEILQNTLTAEEKELKHLKAIYNKALSDINDNIARLKGREDADLQHVIYQIDYQRALKGQVNAILDELNNKQFESISQYMAECYEDGFVGTMYDLAGQGIPIITPIDQKQVLKAMKTDSNISGSLYKKLGEDVDVLKKRIANNLSRGFATGQSYAEMARNIAQDSNVGFNKAARIARTEGARVYNTAAYDAQHKAKKKGADVVKQWDASLDGNTRPSHRMVDGEIKELDERFSNGLMFPSDPSGAASEVINCRCTLLQRATWALDEDELETLKERAAAHGLDKTEQFEDFKKKYLKAAEKMPDEKAIKLLDDEIEVNEAIEYYVSGDGMFVNNYLAGRTVDGVKPDQYFTKDDQWLLDGLDKATTSQEVTQKTLWRSVDASAVFGDISNIDFEALEGSLIYGTKSKKADELLAAAKGKTITEKRFMSTTKDKDVAFEWGDYTGSEHPIVLEFEVPKGIKGKDLKAFEVDGDEQFEVLLQRGLKYDIKDITAEDGSIVVKAKLLGDEVVEKTAKKKAMKSQYKDVEAMNEYDYFTEEQEKFRLDSIKELSGFDGQKAEEVLAALCGTREEYLRNSAEGMLGTDSGWFSGGDRAIRTLATPEAKKKAELIHDYITAAPNYEGTICRGATITKDKLNSLEVGGIFEDNGAIASWTTQDSIARLFAEARSEQFERLPVILELEQSTHCTPAAHLSIFGMEENEVLVSNVLNDKFIITEITESDGITRIKLKEKGD